MGINMEIRKIKPEERVQAGLIGSTVFLEKMDGDDYNARIKNPLAYCDDYKDIWAGFNGEGKMQAMMHVIDFDVRYDGHTVGMTGIGGVSTLPEARIGGYIRKIFEQALPLAREQGKVFSYLYPFSFAFYRKFGYELCCQPNKVSAPAKSFREYKYPEGMSAYAPGDDLTPYLDVYNKFIEDKNIVLARDEAMMKGRIDHNPYTTQKYAYLHRDPAGTPDAYILIGVENNSGGYKMVVRELIWTTPDALHAMFGFIGGLSPQFSSVEWNAPLSINVAAMFSDSYEITVTRPMQGMNRVLNVPKALELIKAPLFNGSAVIKVADKFMPVNDGAYQVEWENGVITKAALTDSAMPDLETDVETLAQLVTGFIDFNEARHKKVVAVHGAEEALRSLFVRKDLCIYDYF
jgi:predicted acetyltransferase